MTKLLISMLAIFKANISVEDHSGNPIGVSILSTVKSHMYIAVARAKKTADMMRIRFLSGYGYISI